MITLRAGTPADGEAVERLSREFADYLRALGDPAPGVLAAAQYRRDSCGPAAAFTTLLAVADDAPIGYLLHYPGYDVDRGGRVLHVAELFVAAAARGRGAGRALMHAAADACRRAQGRAVVWAVYPPNRDARAFYERLGGTYAGDLLMTWQPTA